VARRGGSGIRADEVEWLCVGGGVSGLGGAREVGQDAGVEAGAGEPAEEGVGVDQGPGDGCELRLLVDGVLAAGDGLEPRGAGGAAAAIGRVRALPVRPEHLDGDEPDEHGEDAEVRGERRHHHDQGGRRGRFGDIYVRESK
jgi:hypothetical protein